MASAAQRMMALLRGFSGAHGTYRSEEARPGAPKREIKKTARTLREPVTVDLWEQHLRGERPLGIITITEDCDCWWGAVDIDKYDIDHSELARVLDERSVPAVVCRTKSGGAHVLVFFSEPVQASDVMARLRELAASLGHGESEIFPKQDAILADRGDLGNWLNMPYFGGDRTERYAVRPDGRGMSLDAFLDLGERARMTRDQFLSLRFHREVPEFEQGPPCLEQLASRGVSAYRNESMFSFGVLAKKMRPEGWEDLLRDWNRRLVSSPEGPLTDGEVQDIIRSLRKRDYTYKCKVEPCVSHCNMALCRTRKHGIGPGGPARIIETVQILDSEPPLFFVNLRTGGTVECNSDDILSPRDFQRLVLAQLKQVIPLFKLEDWLPQVQTCIESATVIEAPREVGTTGHFEELLERFCTDRHAAQNEDEILLGKPWHDEKRHRVIFRLRDLMAFLEREKFRDLSRTKIATRIEKMGGGRDFKQIRGKGTNFWWVPEEKLEWVTSSVPAPTDEDQPL